MADFTKCSAGTLFYGNKSRLFQISKWWKDVKPRSPTEIVDSTKIRLICLYISQEVIPKSPSAPFIGLPGIGSTHLVANRQFRDFATFPRRISVNSFQGHDQILGNRQFWLNFMVNEDLGLAEVNLEICKHFSKIPFHHWIQAALGCRTDAVDDLFTSVSMLRHKLNQVHNRPGRNVRVQSLPKISHVNPLTRAVFDDRNDPFLPMERVNFILDPIRIVLEASNPKHLAQNLIILGLRFEAAFIRPAIVNWSTRLSTDFSFTHSITTHGPEALAMFLTSEDTACLSTVTIDELQSGVDTAADVRWRQLCINVEETVMSRPSMAKTIIRLAREFYYLRNYFALMAIVSSILAVNTNYANAPSCLNELSVLSPFLDQKGNYEYCRTRTISDGALPWLAPFRSPRKRHSYVNSSPLAVTAMANVVLQIWCYSKYFKIRHEICPTRF